jgi:hypothetical protein
VFYFLSCLRDISLDSVHAGYSVALLLLSGVSNETVKCGREFCGTCSGKAEKRLYSKLQTRPLVREGATK